MTITLLFDLDDTLLATNMDAFIPAYFNALSSALAEKVAPEVMLPALIGGTRAMMTNLDPALTMREVFDAWFFPRLNVDRSMLQAAIDRFYVDVFPSLGALTSPILETVPLVDWAFAQGYRVAIATNPLFPLTAIEQRLRWAGLPPEKYPFDLVTSYENMHFAKETVAYYPEVLAQLGWPEDPVVMVGDDIEREVKPTRAAGLPVFLVRRSGETSQDLIDVPQGTLDSLRGWLEKVDLSTLKFNIQALPALLANLRSTPAALASLTRSLSPEAWAHKPQPGEWNLTEVICHLRDVEREIYLPRLKKVLAEDNPFLPAVKTDAWPEERNYAGQAGPQVLSELLQVRKETIALISNLQADGWSRTGRHTVFGPTSLQELVSLMAAHDRTHVRQVWSNLKALR